MIAEAAEGGAFYGKIQTIFADDLSRREQFEEGLCDESGKVKIIKRPYRPEYERLKGLELTYEQHRLFVDECQRAGLVPLTTAFNITSIPGLEELGWKAIKVASYDCGSLPLIKALSSSFDRLIISTGASYGHEIEATAKFLSEKEKDFTFLHCVTVYPTPLNLMNLRRMEYLRRLAPSMGLSDHSLVSRDGVKASIAAIYLGADVIERHFTVLPEEETRDGRVSVRKEHFRELVMFSRLSKEEQKNYINENVPKFESMLGPETGEPSAEELINRAYYRGRFCNKIGGREIFNWEEFDWEAFLGRQD
jgi:N,N'-diacetyllegionaminate synthase